MNLCSHIFNLADELFLKLKDILENLVLSHLRSCASLESVTTSIEGLRLEVNGRSWSSQPDSDIKDYDVIYIGGEGRTLTNLMMILNGSRFYSYNPVSQICRIETSNVNKDLMKRFYLIERAKDANIIGIVVGTLAVSNYLAMHSRLKELIKKAGLVLTCSLT